MTIWIYVGNNGDCIGPYESLDKIDAQHIRISIHQRRMIEKMTPGKYPGRFHDVEIEVDA